MNFYLLSFWILLALFVGLLEMRLKKENFQNGYSVRDITFDALFLAIIIIMGFVPEAGYISVFPGFSLTLIHLPVLIGSYLKGFKRGILYGLFFGLTSWFQALLNGTGLNALFIYPWISVLPRLIFGAIAGLWFQIIRKNTKLYGNVWVIAFSGFVLTMIHSVLVFASLFVFYPHLMVGLFGSKEKSLEGLALTFTGIVLLSMLGESSLAAITTPLVGKTIEKIKKN